LVLNCNAQGFHWIITLLDYVENDSVGIQRTNMMAVFKIVMSFTKFKELKQWQYLAVIIYSMFNEHNGSTLLSSYAVQLKN
jgi:hypothetical protein